MLSSIILPGIASHAEGERINGWAEEKAKQTRMRLFRFFLTTGQALSQTFRSNSPLRTEVVSVGNLRRASLHGILH